MYLLCGESKDWGGGRHKKAIFLNVSGRHFSLSRKKVRNAVVGRASARAVTEEGQSHRRTINGTCGFGGRKRTFALVLTVN